MRNSGSNVVNLLEISGKCANSKSAVRSKINPPLDRLGSKVLLSNKRGLCLINRKLAQRIDGLSKPGPFADLGDRELLPFRPGLNLVLVSP
jgi:hypothetical protein